jgi:hypothetical protein
MQLKKKKEINEKWRKGKNKYRDQVGPQVVT